MRALTVTRPLGAWVSWPTSSMLSKFNRSSGLKPLARPRQPCAEGGLRKNTGHWRPRGIDRFTRRFRRFSGRSGGRLIKHSGDRADLSGPGKAHRGIEAFPFVDSGLLCKA